MLDVIRRDGWTIARTPNLRDRNNWWTYQFVRGDPATIEFVKAMTSGNPTETQRGGLPRGTWAMWAVTLAVIIGLFLLCVVLVLTAEVCVSPA